MTIPRPRNSGVNSSATGIFLLVAILLLAFGAGVMGLNADILWADEIYSVSNIGAFDPPYGPAKILESLRQHSTDHLPLYYFLAAGWARMVGWSQVALRYLSVLSGVLMIALVYRHAIAVVNRRAAFASAFLMSTNAFVILYFHEIRMYTLLMLFAVLQWYHYWRLSNGKTTVTGANWMVFVVTTSALLYTHVFAFFQLAALGIFHLLFVPKSRRWWNIAFAGGLGILMFFPYLPQLLNGIGSVTSQEGLSSRALPTGDLVTSFAHVFANAQDLLWLPLAVCIGFGLLSRRDSIVRKHFIVAAIMFAVILLMNWHFQLIPQTRIRYFLLLWFPLILVASYGLTSLPYWRVATAAFAIAWALAGFQFASSSNLFSFAGIRSDLIKYPPAHRISDLLHGQVDALDYFVGFTDSKTINGARKHGWSTADYYIDVRLGINGEFIHKKLKPDQLEGDVVRIAAKHPYILLAHNPQAIPPNLPKTLEYFSRTHIECTSVLDAPDLTVHRWASRFLGCDHSTLPIAFDNGIRVIERAASYDPANDVVRTLIWWQVPDENMLQEYNVSLQILSPDWQNVRHTDRHLHDKLTPWAIIDLSTTELSAGDYRLVLILYRRDSGVKVSGVGHGSEDPTTFLSLLSFSIDS